jgi:hypothetical protein
MIAMAGSENRRDIGPEEEKMPQHQRSPSPIFGVFASFPQKEE